MASLSQIKYVSTVTARSVQLLRSKSKEEGSERERNFWWDEVRDEVCKSALALGCTHVLGYREMVVIQQDIHVMTAIGTAIKYQPNKKIYPDLRRSSKFDSLLSQTKLLPSSKSTTNLQKKKKEQSFSL